MKWLIIPSVVFCSCSLFAPKFHSTTFNYNSVAGVRTAPIIAPAGFNKVERSDDGAGNYGVLYHYGAAKYFVVFLQDTAAFALNIDTSVNQPLDHPDGGQVYKGIDANSNFWRELKKQHLRVGYENVPKSMEGAFDQASNVTSRNLFGQQ